MIHKKNGPAAMVRDGDPGSWSTRNASAHGAGSDLARHVRMRLSREGGGHEERCKFADGSEDAKTAKEVAK